MIQTKLPRVCNPKPCFQYRCSLVCDVIDFICDFKLFKTISRNYFDVTGGLITFLGLLTMNIVIRTETVAFRYSDYNGKLPQCIIY